MKVHTTNKYDQHKFIDNQKIHVNINPHYKHMWSHKSNKAHQVQKNIADRYTVAQITSTLTFSSQFQPTSLNIFWHRGYMQPFIRCTLAQNNQTMQYNGSSAIRIPSHSKHGCTLL